MTGTSVTYVGEPGHTYSFYSIAHDQIGNTEAAPTDPDTTIVLAPTEEIILNGQRPTRSFTDEDGTLVNVVWSGAGIATLHRWVNPTNQQGNILDIDVTGSNAQSSLKIKPVDGNTTLSTLAVHSAIGSLKLKGVNVLDHVSVDKAAKLTLGNLVGGADVTITGVSRKGIAVRVGDVPGDSDLVSASPIRGLQAIRWTEGAITAPSLARLTTTGSTQPQIAGDFGADLTLADGALPLTLGAAKIAGSVAGGTWAVAGNAGQIVALSTAADWTANFAGSLKKLKVAGAVDTAEIRAEGDISSVTVGALLHSRIFAGVKDTVAGLPDSLDDFASPARIGALTVKGVEGVANAVADSIVAASRLGAVVFRDIMTVNGGQTFGLAADKIASLLVYEGAVLKESRSKLDAPADGFTVDDFVVRLV